MAEQATWKSLNEDIKLCNDTYGNSFDGIEVQFLSAGGELFSVGDVLWDAENGCWIITEAEDD